MGTNKEQIIPIGVTVEIRIQEQLNKEMDKIELMIEERTKKHITPLEDRLKVLCSKHVESIFRERKAWQNG